ncbi:MAG: biopolymer transporter ExbD [Proteobacteria bacterium]|nr:biopolymer transporter ExbD [Pseudomonadota bacterium]
MARRHATQEEETEINITPMLDVVFIMLIFFIVTTSFIKETGIDPNRPEAETAMPNAHGNILIAISEFDQVWMNKGQIDLAQIRAMVESAVAEIPESSVIIIADEKASTGVLIDLMDQVRLGGVANIMVAAKEVGN